MKKHIITLTVFLFCCMPLTAHAATPITDEMANKYFSNCIEGAQKQGTMSSQGRQNYCACTAMHMQESMTVEDLADLSSKDQKIARQALNKVLVSVNGPCMQYPVSELIQKKCMTDLKDAAICGCLSKKVGSYMAETSQQMMPKILEENPDIYDPLTPIMESKDFQHAQQSIAITCATSSKH